MDGREITTRLRSLPHFAQHPHRCSYLRTTAPAVVNWLWPLVVPGS